MPDPNSSIVEVRTHFVRGRNALVARADFEPLYIDYYLHRAEHNLVYENADDDMLKDLLAALTLHLASRPQDETSGWTLNFHKPLLNVFATGASRPGHVAGRIFKEDVRDMGKNIFNAQTTRPQRPLVQSVTEFSGTNVFRAVEDYYAQSEQRLARIFRYSEEDIVMISAQPDCDESWLAALTVDDVRELDQKEKLSPPLERRKYAWDCGCSAERLYPVLARLTEEDLDHAFGSDEFITLTCPRCGARHRAVREQFEAWREEHAKG